MAAVASGGEHRRMPIDFGFDFTRITPEDECPLCASTLLVADHVRSTFWHNDQLAAVVDIPAITCEGCGEKYFDEVTHKTRQVSGDIGFSSENADYILNVPVFSLTKWRLTRGGI
jgi:YgiT-type zinc finger domain-containing protein